MNLLKRFSKVTVLFFAMATISAVLSGCGSNSNASNASNSENAAQATITDSDNPLNLDDAGLARVHKILDEVGSDDASLNALTHCIAKYYDDLNATFFDPNQREVPMANVQDCTEGLNPEVVCRPADNGTGPVCGLANKRTGYSLSTIFGYMAG